MSNIISLESHKTLKFEALKREAKASELQAYRDVLAQLKRMSEVLFNAGKDSGDVFETVGLRYVKNEPLRTICSKGLQATTELQFVMLETYAALNVELLTAEGAEK